MKRKTLLALATLFIFLTAEAQIEKGKVFASGSLGFNFSTYRDTEDGVTESETKSTDFSLTPRGGIFITDAILVGAGIGLSTGMTKYDDDDKYSYSSISFTPFIRYYLLQKFFGQLELGPGLSTDKWSYSGYEDDKDKYSMFLWSIGAGYAHFLNNNVSVEPIITYTSTSYTDRNNTNQKDKYGVLGFQIGLSIYLDCQKEDL
jgi:hypothetical protein